MGRRLGEAPTEVNRQECWPHPTAQARQPTVGQLVDDAYDSVDGFARHMRDALPHASFIGFTGTPIERQDANTRAVFGDDISVYDIQRAVENGATAPIYYESRLAKLALDEAERPRIDPGFEEATEGEEVERILRKHGYPPDKQEKATQTVLEQAAVLSAEWATI
jgi:type I site-specific restriction-modification system R (restriction) subunit